jgi:hypothetical protein
MPGDCETIYRESDHDLSFFLTANCNHGEAGDVPAASRDSTIIPSAIARDTPDVAAFWHARFTAEHTAMLRAFRANDLDYALRSVRHYSRAQAMAIGFAARTEWRAP